MAKTRKDERGRALRKGEVQRASDKRYMYTYTDPLGRRRSIYAQDLATLREKEKQLMKDQLDGLDLYVAGKATINDTYDRYISTKYDLRATTITCIIALSDILSVRRKSQTLSIQMYSSFIATCLMKKSYR